MATAGMIATAAFFAPLMVTSPTSLFPPVITYFSKKRPSQKVCGRGISSAVKGTLPAATQRRNALHEVGSFVMPAGP